MMVYLISQSKPQRTYAKQPDVDAENISRQKLVSMVLDMRSPPDPLVEIE